MLSMLLINKTSFSQYIMHENEKLIAVSENR